MLQAEVLHMLFVFLPDQCEIASSTPGLYGSLKKVLHMSVYLQEPKSHNSADADIMDTWLCAYRDTICA